MLIQLQTKVLVEKKKGCRRYPTASPLQTKSSSLMHPDASDFVVWLSVAWSDARGREQPKNPGPHAAREDRIHFLVFVPFENREIIASWLIYYR